MALAIALLLAISFGFGQETRILYFHASPRAIHSGDLVTLSWETSGTTTIAMEWRPVVDYRGTPERRTGLPAKGKFEDHPRVSTIYILECSSALGFVCASASATVLVK